MNVKDTIEFLGAMHEKFPTDRISLELAPEDPDQLILVLGVGQTTRRLKLSKDNQALLSPQGLANLIKDGYDMAQEFMAIDLVTRNRKKA